MPNTYTQLYIQYVFAVKNRKPLISVEVRIPIEKYIYGIITQLNHKMLAIYCMPDHCHIFVGMSPTQSVSELARMIKGNSSKWINAERLTRQKFSWQEGYGAFSYAKSQQEQVIKYILHQPEHHRKRSFQEEYLNFLKKFEVDYDEKYVF